MHGHLCTITLTLMVRSFMARDPVFFKPCMCVYVYGIDFALVLFLVGTSTWHTDSRIVMHQSLVMSIVTPKTSALMMAKLKARIIQQISK